MVVVIIKYLKLHVTDIIPNEKVKCSQEKIFFAEHFQSEDNLHFE